MSRFSVHVDLIWELGIGKRIDMASDWIKAILQEKDGQRELARQNHEMAKRGEMQAPNLFRMLKDQVQKDVAEFNRACPSGPLVDFGFQPSSKFTVRHSTFPVIQLDVTLETGTISCRRTEKKSSSADTTVDESTIFVMSGSNMDQAYFSIKGNEYREESQVSELLLTPIFRALP
jgi:hypothetical protein